MVAEINPLYASVIVALIAGITGSGMTNMVQFFVSRNDAKKDAKSGELKLQSDMLMGLGHDRIVYLGSKYLKRGYITHDEYENINNYLYQPYMKLGGNGTAKKIMSEVEKLPLRDGVEKGD